jgi:hypothetical protein
MSDEGEQTPKGRDPATGRWLPGHAPPGAGRPKGARHKATMAAEALLDGEAKALTRKAIEKALALRSGSASSGSSLPARIAP